MAGAVSDGDSASSTWKHLADATRHQATDKLCSSKIPAKIQEFVQEHSRLHARYHSFIHRLKTENFRSSYLLVPEIKVLHTRSFHRLIRRF